MSLSEQLNKFFFDEGGVSPYDVIDREWIPSEYDEKEEREFWTEAQKLFGGVVEIHQGRCYEEPNIVQHVFQQESTGELVELNGYHNSWEGTDYDGARFVNVTAQTVTIYK